MLPTTDHSTRPRRRWKAGAAAALTAALLAGGGTAAAFASTAPQSVAPAAAASTPSPSASGHAGPGAQRLARVALRRVLAVVIRQDGSDQYGQHAQRAARVLTRHPAVFKHVPEKMQQDLKTLADAPAGDAVKDAQTVKDRALDGTYGDAVKKAAEAIQKAPAKARQNGSPSPSATPSPSLSASS
ncbi:hypothetical protein [Sinomonas sp. B1-1]|uniref:hypothetical protein n=1 Tax=Sinomonas sp. B1-1 TaxID=3141454 RepID=UPI003D27BAAB